MRALRFSVYGNRAAAPGVSGALGFNGQYLEHTCLYLPGSYRAYSPALRRFCQPDNLSPFAAGGLNAYAWCLGDPVNRVDPDGHFARSLMLIGGVVQAAGSIVGAVLSEGDARTALIISAVVGGVIMGASRVKLARFRARDGEPALLATYRAPNPAWSDRPPRYPSPPPYQSRSPTPLPHMSPPSYDQARLRDWLYGNASMHLPPPVQRTPQSPLSSADSSFYGLVNSTPPPVRRGPGGSLSTLSVSLTSLSSTGSGGTWEPWRGSPRTSSRRFRIRQEP